MSEKSCRHLLAPLMRDQEECDRYQLRNYRKCAGCGDLFWDDGLPMAYLGNSAHGVTQETRPHDA
jgi:hypothetical protein